MRRQSQDKTVRIGKAKAVVRSVRDFPSGPFPSICGLDVSLSGTGIAACPHGKIMVARVSSPAVHPGTDGRIDRWQYLASRITSKLLEFGVPRKSLVVLEAHPLAVNPKAFRGVVDRIEAGGVVRSVLLSAGYRMAECNVSTLKLWTAGHGNATKEQMVEAVNRRWNLSLTDDNHADAVALMQWGIAQDARHST